MFENIKNIAYTNIHGVLEAIQPFEEIAIETSVGSLVPIYKVEDQGRKKLTPVKFDSDGKIKSLQLQESRDIETSIGMFSTEFITFYPDGQKRRLFQLNGKLSGYWSEQNEYELAKTIDIPSPIGNINAKPIYVHFYESGAIKSITFWPKERVSIVHKGSKLEIKTGISFYPCGALKSYEPAEPVVAPTLLGNIEAFDPEPLGINGEQNSLKFIESGEVSGLSTVKAQIVVINSSGTEEVFTPLELRSRCNDELFVIQPLKIEFATDEVVFKHGFKIIGRLSKDLNFRLKEFVPQQKLATRECCS